MEVLATVNRHTGWMEEFQHWQQRHHHGRLEDRVVYAGVIGIGCAIGIRKMARISHPISESELENVVNWYFSVDNINAASDRVLQLTDRLELPKLLRHTPDRSHTSSDGQKFEVRVDSLNANHSFKYFGKEQGVSVYTFRDERDLLWHSLVFSAADRESAYVIDGLMHNAVVKATFIPPMRLATAKPSLAPAIWWASPTRPVSRTSNVNDAISSGVANTWIAPSGKLSQRGTAMKESIIQFWDDILRFIATIKLKETTASDIFRRLNSYSKQHGLYHALKAFGQILKSIFILRVIESRCCACPLKKCSAQLSMSTPSRARSRSAIHVNSCRRRRKIRRWPKPANGSSRIASSAGITCICRRNSPRSMIRPNGRNCCRPWPTGRRPPGGI
jgi:hypothetical protein